MIGAMTWSAFGGAVGGASGTALYNACMGRPVPSKGRCISAATAGAACGAACGAVAAQTGHTVLGETVRKGVVIKSDGDSRGLCLDAAMNMNLSCACACAGVDLWTGRDIRRLRRSALSAPDGTFWEYAPSAPEDRHGMGDQVMVEDVDQAGEVACRVCPHRRVTCNACNGTGRIQHQQPDARPGEDGCPWCDSTGEAIVEQDYRRNPTDEQPTECYLVRFVCTSRVCGLACEVPVTVVLPADVMSPAPPPPPPGAGCLVRTGSGVLHRTASDENVEDMQGLQVPSIRIGTPRGRHCAVCWSERASVHFAPCSHVACCEDCAERVYPNCPICRSNIGTMRTVRSPRSNKLGDEIGEAEEGKESCSFCM